jgi:hypothetical protein
MSQWNRSMLLRIAEVRKELKKGEREGYNAIYNIPRANSREVAAAAWKVALQDLEPPLRRQRKSHRKRIALAMKRWGKENAHRPRQRDLEQHRRLCKELSRLTKSPRLAYRRKKLALWDKLLARIGDCL